MSIAHRRTKALEKLTQMADILVVGVGRPAFLTGAMVKPGAVVIDVGTTRVEGPQFKNGYALKGDVDFAEASANSRNFWRP